MKNTKRQGSVLIIVIVALALAAIGGLTYYALAPKPLASPIPVASATVATATPTIAKTTKFTAGDIIFELPTGWKETSTIASDDEGDHLFSNVSTGDYLAIKIFTEGGGDGASDVIWHYKLAGKDSKSFVLVNEGADCDPQLLCPHGDGQLAVTIDIQDLPDYKLHGKYYVIGLGNTKSETADRQTYRDIMKSARIR